MTPKMIPNQIIAIGAPHPAALMQAEKLAKTFYAVRAFALIYFEGEGADAITPETWFAKTLMARTVSKNIADFPGWLYAHHLEGWSAEWEQQCQLLFEAEGPIDADYRGIHLRIGEQGVGWYRNYSILDGATVIHLPPIFVGRTVADVERILVSMQKCYSQAELTRLRMAQEEIPF